MKNLPFKKRNWMHYFKGLNEKNVLLLTNLKKSLRYKDISDETIFSYQKDIYSFMLWLQEREINTLEATVDNLIEYLDGLDISEARKTRILSCLSTFYKHNVKVKQCKVNIVKEYRKMNKG